MGSMPAAAAPFALPTCIYINICIYVYNLNTAPACACRGSGRLKDEQNYCMCGFALVD